MKVHVDEDLCIGCGACEDECPDVFALSDDDGLSHVIRDPVGEDLFECVQIAAKACPVDAITYDAG
jgi:ferredoxin